MGCIKWLVLLVLVAVVLLLARECDKEPEPTLVLSSEITSSTQSPLLSYGWPGWISTHREWKQKLAHELKARNVQDAYIRNTLKGNILDESGTFKAKLRKPPEFEAFMALPMMSKDPSVISATVANINQVKPIPSPGIATYREMDWKATNLVLCISHQPVVSHSNGMWYIRFKENK